MSKEDHDYLRRLFESPRAAADASQSDSAALDFLDAVRWPSGVVCPRCGGEDVVLTPGRAARRRGRRCLSCSHQFTPTSGTPVGGERSSPAELVLAVAAAGLLSEGELHEGIQRITGRGRRSTRRLARTLATLRTRSLDARSGPAGVSRVAVALGGLAAVAAGTLIVSLLWWRSAPLSSSWIHAGQVRSMVTPRAPGEDVREWHDRHREITKRNQERFPPDSRAR